MSWNALKEALSALEQSNPRFSQRMAEAEVIQRWESVVGPMIAKYARARTVRDSVLWVEVDHPGWRTELHHRKNQLLHKLNESFQEKHTPIKDLFFLDPRRPKREKTYFKAKKKNRLIF